MYKRSSIFWGVLLIILAALLLLREIEYLPGSVWDYFWPAALILVGVWMIVGYFFRGRTAPPENISVDLGSARSVSFKLNHGAGKLNLHAGAAAGNALSGSCRGGLEVQSETEDDRLEVKLRVPSQFWEWSPGRGLDWDLALTGEVPLKLKINSGASSAALDLADLLVTDLKLETGASSTEITMPARAGNTLADINAGVSSLKISIPNGVAARIRVKSGMTSVQVDSARFPRLEGDVYQSADYAAANNRADITLEAGMGSIEIK
ncbi:MAG: hypothetical protein FD146_772 [Anaerolineaceae bacterium]|nr:MAG: hypothetical protein FD146_772 [Anaerolineaceae bacterium]